MQEGKFREDLYFRLNVVHIQMPPLRDRREDIPLLATAFLKEFARENNKEFKPLSRDALEAVRNYQWPGNVRELRTAMEHGVVMSNSASIGLHHLPPQLQDTSPEAAPQERPEDNAPNTQNGLVPAGVLNLASLLERNAIQQALAQSNGNKTAAAHLLGISAAHSSTQTTRHPPFMNEPSSLGSRTPFIIILILLLAITGVQYFFNFNGLGTDAAMDHAQIARNVARGQGMTTNWLQAHPDGLRKHTRRPQPFSFRRPDT